MTARRDLEEPAPLGTLRPGARVYWWCRRTGGRRLGTVAGEPQAHRRGPATVRVLEGTGETNEAALYHATANAHGAQSFPVDALRIYQAPTKQEAPSGIAPRVSSTIPTTTTTTAQGAEALRLI